MSIRHEVDRAIHGADEAARFERAAEHIRMGVTKGQGQRHQGFAVGGQQDLRGVLRWRARNDRAETILLEHARGGGVVRMGAVPGDAAQGRCGEVVLPQAADGIDEQELFLGLFGQPAEVPGHHGTCRGVQGHRIDGVRADPNGNDIPKDGHVVRRDDGLCRQAARDEQPEKCTVTGHVRRILPAKQARSRRGVQYPNGWIGQASPSLSADRTAWARVCTWSLP